MSKIQYYGELTEDLYREVCVKFPDSLSEAHDIARGNLSHYNFSSYEAKIVAEVFMAKGYMIAKHTEKLE